jgi:DNA-binding transcriptional LysR family regulator
VPRSTLSRQIQRLEAELGVELMQRTTRVVRLTEAGRGYLQRCAQALSLIGAAGEVARDSGNRAKGLLRVTAPIDVAREVVAGMLPELRRRYPELELSFEITQRKLDIVAEGIDLALRGGPRLEDSSLVAQRLARQHFALYASPAYLLARGTPHSVAELSEHDLLALSTPQGVVPWRFEGPLGKAELVPRAWLCSNELTILRAATAAGLGIGLAEPITSARDIQDGRITPVLPDHVVQGGALYAVYANRKRIPLKVRAFVGVLSEHLRQLGWGR